MVLAGAGTGKTRVLVHRIARLVESGVRAVGDPRGDVHEQGGGRDAPPPARSCSATRADAMWIGTFHATCARLLRRYGEHVGLTQELRDLRRRRPDRSSVERAAQGDGARRAGLARGRSCRASIARRTAASTRGRSKTGAFDDIVERDLSDVPGAAARRRTRSTSTTSSSRRSSCSTHEDRRAQLRVAVPPRAGRRVPGHQPRPVRAGAASSSSATRNLTVVGDDDQSIYAWRGAEPRNLLDFDRDFPDAKVVKLEQNYRSTQMILDAANGDHPARTATATTRRCGPSTPAATRSRSIRRATSAARRTASRSRSAALLDEGPCSPSDIAILYRTNAQSRVLEEHLRAARVPAQGRRRGSRSSSARRSRTSSRTCACSANPAADSAFERVVNVPARGIGETTVDRLRAARARRRRPMLDAARLAARGEVGGHRPGAAQEAARRSSSCSTLEDHHRSGCIG